MTRNYHELSKININESFMGIRVKIIREFKMNIATS